MKITVDINEIWLDEKNDLEPQLKAHIIQCAVNQISKSIEEKVNKQIIEAIKSLTESNLEKTINEYVDKFIADETIVVRNEDVNLSEHLKQLFTVNRGWSNLESHVDRYAKRYSEDVKKQYDAAFATKVVMNMREQGLLKDEVVQILLDK